MDLDIALTDEWTTAKGRCSVEIEQIMQMLKGKTEAKFVRFVSDKGPNSCEFCRAHHGKIFRMDDPEKPQLPIHPNCRCKYEEIEESEVPASAGMKDEGLTPVFTGENKKTSKEATAKSTGQTGKTSIAKREKSSFNHVVVRVMAPGDSGYGKFSTKHRLGDFSQIGMLCCTGIDDLLTCLEKRYPQGNISSLLLIGHSGDDAGFFVGNENLRSMDKNQIKRFRKLLAPYALLELRMCSTVRGERGKKAAQRLARTLNVIVIAYENPVTAFAFPAFSADESDPKKGTKETRYFQPVNRRIFFPR